MVGIEKLRGLLDRGWTAATSLHGSTRAPNIWRFSLRQSEMSDGIPNTVPALFLDDIGQVLTRRHRSVVDSKPIYPIYPPIHQSNLFILDIMLPPDKVLWKDFKDRKETNVPCLRAWMGQAFK